MKFLKTFGKQESYSIKNHFDRQLNSFYTFNVLLSIYIHRESSRVLRVPLYLIFLQYYHKTGKEI